MPKPARAGRTCRPELQTDPTSPNTLNSAPVRRLCAALAPPDARAARADTRGRRPTPWAATRRADAARDTLAASRAHDGYAGNSARARKFAGFARSRAPQRSCRTGDGRGRHEREAPALWERARGLAGPLFGLRAGPRPDARPHAGRTRRRDIKKRV